MSSTDRLRRVESWWRPRRLSLVGLDGTTAWVARTALTLVITLCVLILVYGIGIGVPFGTDRVPEMLPIPRLVELLVLCAVAVAAAAVAVASRSEGPIRRRLLLLPFALLALAIGGEVREVGRLIGRHPLLLTGGLVVATLGCLPLVLPARVWRWRPAVAPAVAAAPYAAVLVLYALAGSEAYRLSPEFIANRNTGWNNILTLHEAVARGAVAGALLPAVFAVNLFLIWQTIETARATRDAAGGGLRAREHAPTLLALALGAKVVFLLIAYTTSAEWAAHSRADGVLSWALAVLLVAAGVAALLHSPPRIADRQVSVTATVAVAGLTLGLGAVGMLLVLRGALHLSAESAVFDAFSTAIGAVDDATTWLSALWPFALTGAGLVLLARRRVGLGVGLVLFGVWGLPRAIALAGDLAAYSGTPLPVGRPVDYIEGDEQYAGWVDIATLDVVITIALLGLSIAFMRGRQSIARPVFLLFTLVLSSVVAYGGALIPGNWRTGSWFYLGLVFPVAYAYLLGARPLNQQTRRRDLKVATALAFTVFLLALTTLQVFNDETRPGTVASADVGKVFLQVPLICLLALARVSATRERHEPAAP